MSGRVVHFELPYDDEARASAFYRDVFGWDTQKMEQWDYVSVMTGPSGDRGPTEPGYIGGGMTTRGGTNTAPVITIGTDDIDAAFATIREHGGEPLGDKQPVGDMGWAAYFRDPEGNVVGLWQNA
jgi:uncharacterized protein